MLKIVLDTNALIDGSDDFYNYSSRIIDLVIADQVEAYANSGTLRENKLLAQRKIKDDAYLRKLEYFFDSVHPVDIRERLSVVEEDPEDNKILESAVNSNADYLITSDRHLLKLENYNGTRIVRPEIFWSIWEEEGEGWGKWVKSFIK
jgi:putative PIN family toxin of toxin-antitoxin system